MSTPDRDSSDAGGEPGSGAGSHDHPGERTAVARFGVPGMDCPSCAGKIENALDSLAGVSAIDARPTTGSVRVTYDPNALDEAGMKSAIESAGYEVVESSTDAGDDADGSDTREDIRTSPRALKTWASGVFVAAGLLFEFLLTGSNVQLASVVGRELLVADIAFLVAVAVGGQEIVRNGYYSARNLNLDIDFLMSVAILGALVASVAFGEALYFEAATLAFLFSVAELLERYSMDRARNSLRELMDLSPEEATVRRDGEEVTVPVDELAVGDVVVVRPGEKIPTDGEVLEGESAVNQAPITGESVPVDKTVGEGVYAGTINEEGYLEVQVTSAAGEDTLSRIVELVEDAQSNRTEREQFVERFSAYYTPVVVAFAVLVTLASPAVLGTTWPTAIVYGLTLLVLACPCAFVISTPVSVVSGITSAAKNGVLIKGGNHLEAMGEIDVVAFDKTGTITKGQLTVTDVVALNGTSEEDVLRCARGLERRSEHPIGEAIVAYAEREQVDEREIEEFESITGKGVRADLDGTPHFAGKPGLFEELGFDLSHVHATTDGGAVTRTARKLCERNDCLDLLEDTVPRLQSEGKTVVLVGTDEELEGVIGVADEIRPEAAATVARLRELGVERTVMLTGDNERTARAIADQVGVDEYRAELLPEEKVGAIEELVATHEGVAMIGDGINDAPALATATVGIAMGAAGTDTALETADIALMADDLSKLPYLYELAHDANGVIRQNVYASLAVKATLAIGVPFGYVPIWLAVLAGDAGMTTAVTGNAMRLSRITSDDAGARDQEAPSRTA
ncbi:heavy metal translocating P-type ATPase [Halalkalicoccus jeotgali]|uniref:Zinc-transporting ATPase n=1 Tax=Halalkalicoccus jeotgali (strain DSM 18796 / CECT 7217 / JCM 14584 / KCTC 4019 / B3) TaxID=795797 RepID=D8JA47_HALJB|nr:cation-translocating P-type ATPase [Halalkalicoccus jeotgali]ADJ14569.1 zinc-transporting ATPase [Halalkalicoccus jeotgali B3]ELY39941.1 zinc-transporting ATPase [Halalkalicoccus jeotgali B3]